MTEQEQRVEIALRTLAIPHEGNPHVNREVIAAANAVLLDALGGAPKPAVEPEPPLAGAEGTRDDLLSSAFTVVSDPRLAAGTWEIHDADGHVLFRSRDSARTVRDE